MGRYGNRYCSQIVPIKPNAGGLADYYRDRITTMRDGSQLHYCSHVRDRAEIPHRTPNPAHTRRKGYEAANTIKLRVSTRITSNSPAVPAPRRTQSHPSKCDTLPFWLKRLIPAYSLGIMSRHDAFSPRLYKATAACFSVSPVPVHDHISMKPNTLLRNTA